MPPIESRPYFCLDALELGWRRGRSPRPSVTSRHGSVILLADHRLGDAVLVGGVAPGEAALDAGMAVVGLAVLVGHHAHDRVALHLRLEGAADAAIGAGRDDAVLGLAHRRSPIFSIRVAVGQAWTQAPQETHSESRKASSCPAETCESKPRPSMVSAKVPCTSSQARTQREQTMHLAGSKVK